MLLEGMLLLEDLEQDMLVLDQKLDLDLYIRISGSLVAVSMGLLLLLVLLMLLVVVLLMLGLLLLVLLLSLPQLVRAFAGNGSVVTGYRSGTETTAS
jgi:hypothetical protein